MELEFFGGNCFKIKTKETTLIVDDNLQSLGKKSIQNEKTVAIYTNKFLMNDSAHVSRLIVDSPGEYEIGDITVTGVQARAHMDEDGVRTSTVYQFSAQGKTVTVLGHIHPSVGEELLELVGGTDVLVVPVGGNGFTLDPAGAASLIKKVEPDVVVPSQYEINGLNYEVPAQPLEEFGKLFTLEEPQESLKLNKPSTEDSGSTHTKVVVLIAK